MYKVSMLEGTLFAVDTPFDPRDAERRVAHRMAEGVHSYLVYLRLVGDGCTFVRRVTYRFHPTVEPQAITLERNTDNPDFLVSLWLWGVFPVTVDVVDTGGSTFSFRHDLTFNRFLEKQVWDENNLKLFNAA